MQEYLFFIQWELGSLQDFTIGAISTLVQK